MIHLESEWKQHRDGCGWTEAWENSNNSSKKAPDKAPKKITGAERD
jgi:hypothetical protein